MAVAVGPTLRRPEAASGVLMPPVITRASVVGAERSRDLFENAYREHARAGRSRHLRGGVMAA
jgi:hypothetical protein